MKFLTLTLAIAVVASGCVAPETTPPSNSAPERNPDKVEASAPSCDPATKARLLEAKSPSFSGFNNQEAVALVWLVLHDQLPTDCLEAQ